jgi:hypothetical protein
MAKRKYKVVSDSTTLGHSKGSVFEYDFDKSPYDEGQLISRGSLERVKSSEQVSEGGPQPRPPIKGVKGVVDAGDVDKPDSSDSS